MPLREYYYSGGLELVFQPGTHIVSEQITNVSKSLSFEEHVNSIIIRGQPDAAIACLHEFCLVFKDVASIKIYNIHFSNCSCLSSDIFYGSTTIGSYGVFFHFTVRSVVNIEIARSTFTDICFIISDDKTLCVIPGINVEFTINSTIFENRKKKLP